MSKSTKILLIIGGLVIIAGVIVLVYYKLPGLSINLTSKDWLKDKNQNLPKKDDIVKDLPSDASTVRLNIPVNIADLMISSKKGLGGLGVETDDPNVYNFVYMDIKKDTPIKSITSGTVTKLNRKSLNEFEITVDSSYGLYINYVGINKPYVKEGDVVREGQEIGLGMNGSQPDSNLLAFSVADANRQGTVNSTFSTGVIVAPLDYLKPDIKMVLLQKYQ